MSYNLNVPTPSDPTNRPFERKAHLITNNRLENIINTAERKMDDLSTNIHAINPNIDFDQLVMCSDLQIQDMLREASAGYEFNQCILSYVALNKQCKEAEQYFSSHSQAAAVTSGGNARPGFFGKMFNFVTRHKPSANSNQDPVNHIMDELQKTINIVTPNIEKARGVASFSPAITSALGAAATFQAAGRYSTPTSRVSQAAATIPDPAQAQAFVQAQQQMSANNVEIKTLTNEVAALTKAVQALIAAQAIKDQELKDLLDAQALKDAANLKAIDDLKLEIAALKGVTPSTTTAQVATGARVIPSPPVKTGAPVPPVTPTAPPVTPIAAPVTPSTPDSSPPSIPLYFSSAFVSAIKPGFKLIKNGETWQLDGIDVLTVPTGEENNSHYLNFETRLNQLNDLTLYAKTNASNITSSQWDRANSRIDFVLTNKNLPPMASVAIKYLSALSNNQRDLLLDAMGLNKAQSQEIPTDILNQVLIALTTKLKPGSVLSYDDTNSTFVIDGVNVFTIKDPLNIADPSVVSLQQFFNNYKDISESIKSGEIIIDTSTSTITSKDASNPAAGFDQLSDYISALDQGGRTEILLKLRDTLVEPDFDVAGFLASFKNGSKLEKDGNEWKLDGVVIFTVPKGMGAVGEFKKLDDLFGGINAFLKHLTDNNFDKVKYISSKIPGKFDYIDSTPKVTIPKGVKLKPSGPIKLPANSSDLIAFIDSLSQENKNKFLIEIGVTVNSPVNKKSLVTQASPSVSQLPLIASTPLTISSAIKMNYDTPLNIERSEVKNISLMLDKYFDDPRKELSFYTEVEEEGGVTKTEIYLSPDKTFKRVKYLANKINQYLKDNPDSGLTVINHAVIPGLMDIKMDTSKMPVMNPKSLLDMLKAFNTRIEKDQYLPVDDQKIIFNSLTNQIEINTKAVNSNTYISDQVQLYKDLDMFANKIRNIPGINESEISLLIEKNIDSLKNLEVTRAFSISKEKITSGDDPKYLLSMGDSEREFSLSDILKNYNDSTNTLTPKVLEKILDDKDLLNYFIPFLESMNISENTAIEILRNIPFNSKPIYIGPTAKIDTPTGFNIYTAGNKTLDYIQLNKFMGLTGENGQSIYHRYIQSFYFGFPDNDNQEAIKFDLSSFSLSGNTVKFESNKPNNTKTFKLIKEIDPNELLYVDIITKLNTPEANIVLLTYFINRDRRYNEITNDRQEAVSKRRSKLENYIQTLPNKTSSNLNSFEKDIDGVKFKFIYNNDKNNFEIDNQSETIDQSTQTKLNELLNSLNVKFKVDIIKLYEGVEVTFIHDSDINKYVVELSKYNFSKEIEQRIKIKLEILNINLARSFTNLHFNTIFQNNVDELANLLKVTKSTSFLRFNPLAIDYSTINPIITDNAEYAIDSKNFKFESVTIDIDPDNKNKRPYTRVSFNTDELNHDDPFKSSIINGNIPIDDFNFAIRILDNTMGYNIKRQIRLTNDDKDKAISHNIITPSFVKIEGYNVEMFFTEKQLKPDESNKDYPTEASYTTSIGKKRIIENQSSNKFTRAITPYSSLEKLDKSDPQTYQEFSKVLHFDYIYEGLPDECLLEEIVCEEIESDVNLFIINFKGKKINIMGNKSFNSFLDIINLMEDNDPNRSKFKQAILNILNLKRVETLRNRIDVNNAQALSIKTALKSLKPESSILELLIKIKSINYHGYKEGEDSEKIVKKKLKTQAVKCQLVDITINNDQTFSISISGRIHTFELAEYPSITPEILLSVREKFDRIINHKLNADIDLNNFSQAINDSDEELITNLNIDNTNPLYPVIKEYLNSNSKPETKAKQAKAIIKGYTQLGNLEISPKQYFEYQSYENPLDSPYGIIGNITNLKEYDENSRKFSTNINNAAFSTPSSRSKAFPDTYSQLIGLNIMENKLNNPIDFNPLSLLKTDSLFTSDILKLESEIKININDIYESFDMPITQLMGKGRIGV